MLTEILFVTRCSERRERQPFSIPLICREKLTAEPVLLCAIGADAVSKSHVTKTGRMWRVAMEIGSRRIEKILQRRLCRCLLLSRGNLLICTGLGLSASNTTDTATHDNDDRGEQNDGMTHEFSLD